MSLALIPTAWTSLDLRTAALFLGESAPVEAVSWWWVELINLYVPAVFRALVLISLLGWSIVSLRASGKSWRLPLAYVVLAGALGPGLLVNSGFKDQWQRARPYQVEAFGGTQQFTRAAVMTDQCNNNCSFVSGHVACGFFFASLMLVQRRRQVLWSATGVSAGLVIGFARIADGAHWLSDVLWAGPITLVCSWAVWKFLLRIYPSWQSDQVAKND
jgi:lipid A 4'-phosphatase